MTAAEGVGDTTQPQPLGNVPFEGSEFCFQGVFSNTRNCTTPLMTIEYSVIINEQNAAA